MEILTADMRGAEGATGTSDSPKQRYRQRCRELHLKCNTEIFRLLPEDVAALSSATSLDLRRNCLGRNGIRALVPVIEQCENLARLVAADNYLSNECIPSLCEALQCCPKLEFLDLSNNPISQPSGKLLLRAVDRMPSLRRIDLSGTLMNPGLARAVMAKVAQRTPGCAWVPDVASLQYKGLRLLRAVQREGAAPRSTAPPQHLASRDLSQAQQRRTLPAALSTSAEGATTQPAASSSPTKLTPLAATPRSAITAEGAAVAAEEHGAAGAEHELVAEGQWFGMETVWDVAAVAAPPEDGWSGLASVMALVRQDETLAGVPSGQPAEMPPEK